MNVVRRLVYASGAPGPLRLPADLAVARYNARPRHPVHVQTSITADNLTEFDRPVGIGALVTVDTTAPVDVPAIAAQVRSLLLSLRPARGCRRRDWWGPAARVGGRTARSRAGSAPRAPRFLLLSRVGGGRRR